MSQQQAQLEVKQWLSEASVWRLGPQASRTPSRRSLSHEISSQLDTESILVDTSQQSTNENNHLPCYWPTIHNSISKICPKFQVLSSRFSQVDELLDAYWAKLCEEKTNSTAIFAKCYNIYWQRVCSQKLWYILPFVGFQQSAAWWNSNGNGRPKKGQASPLLVYLQRGVTCFGLLGLPSRDSKDWPALAKMFH